mmetsp:Transcript_11530/g.40292  ORF Transcript_11530/g.40292 Transcript_11530/m.40292 type:complete len:146 (-) Transcript_11530:194-631(-)
MSIDVAESTGLQDTSQVLAYAANACLGVMLLPQVWQAWRKRHVRHLSWTFLLLSTTSGMLFAASASLLALDSGLAYSSDLLPYAASGAINAICGAALMVAKKRHGDEDDYEGLDDGSAYLEMHGEMQSVRDMSRAASVHLQDQFV